MRAICRPQKTRAIIEAALLCNVESWALCPARFNDGDLQSVRGKACRARRHHCCYARQRNQSVTPERERGHQIKVSTEGRATKRTAGRPADRACQPPIGFRNAQRFGSWNQAQHLDLMAPPRRSVSDCDMAERSKVWPPQVLKAVLCPQGVCCQLSSNI